MTSTRLAHPNTPTNTRTLCTSVYTRYNRAMANIEDDAVSWLLLHLHVLGDDISRVCSFFLCRLFIHFILYLVTLDSLGLRAQTWSLGRVFCEPVALSASVACCSPLFGIHIVLDCRRMHQIRYIITEAVICTLRFVFPMSPRKL